MKKVTTILQAFEGVFGKSRLFDDFKDSNSYSHYETINFKDPYDGQIKYYLTGAYNVKNMPTDLWFKYDPNNQYYFNTIVINIVMKPGFDTRMEMIDFLHYLQFSRLTKPHFIKESLPEDSVKVMSAKPTTLEQIEPFKIEMFVYQPIKPGMNTPPAFQKWTISSDVIEKMDFNNKKDILNNITMYGKFEGINPSGMK